MEKFTVHTGLVAPLDRENVDTDAIIPKQFLKSIKRTGFGPHLFDAWRYLDVGEPGMDLSKRKPNPDFVLNKPQYQGASILLARKNFGCGSSREHAPWALQQYGFKAIVAPSFADIFFTNSFKNGLLLVVLKESEIDRLFHEVAAHPGFKLTIDLPAQTVTAGSGARGATCSSPSTAEVVTRVAPSLSAVLEPRLHSHRWFDCERVAPFPIELSQPGWFGSAPRIGGTQQASQAAQYVGE